MQVQLRFIRKVSSRKSMDQIRNTMMQHEALFKEQVQALHKLYNIQKSAMQDRKRRISSQAKVLAFHSGSVVPTDDQLCGSVLDGKTLRPAYATGLTYKDESLALSLRPFCTFKEIKGGGSLWMDGLGVDTLHTAQSKQMRNFDLEKLPEEYMEESEIKVEPNNSKMVDANSIVSIRTPNTDGISFVGANLAVIQVNSPSLKQMCSESDLTMLSVPSQEINQNCDKASEGKLVEIDVKKSIIRSQNSSNIIEKITSEQFAKCFPAVGNSDAYQDSSPSTNTHMEEPTLSHQGSSIFTSLLNPLERIMEQGHGINSQGSTKLHQDLGSDSTSITTHPKTEEQINCYIGVDSFRKNPVICFQGASTLESLQCEPKASNNFFIQTTIDANNDDLKDSSDGSNSIQPQDQKSCKHKTASVNAENTPELGYCCEEGQTNQGRGEAVKSENEELPQFVQDGLKPSLSGTPSDSGIKQSNRSDHSNSEPVIKTSSDKPFVVTGSNENTKCKSALHEAYESIAAEILLSFAPSKSWADPQSHGTQIKAESAKPGRDSASLDKKWNFRERRYANYSNDGGIKESIKWAKSANRRRTSRRPR